MRKPTGQLTLLCFFLALRVSALEPGPVLKPTCADRREGSFCRQDWKVPGSVADFGAWPASECRAGRCERLSAPQSVYDYPWVGTVLQVSTEPQLRSALAQAEANPEEAFTLQLTDGAYNLGYPLTFRRGQVIVRGNPLNPGNVRLHHISHSLQDRVLLVQGENPGDFPLLALDGVTLEGGQDPPDNGGGAGVRAQDAGLIIENSIIRTNLTFQSGPGVVVVGGFFLMDKSRVLGNGHWQGNLHPCGEDLAFQGGGIRLEDVDEAYILNSTLSENYHCRGGGLSLSNSRTLVLNSTIARNQAASWGGGIGATGGGALSLRFNTISQNQAAAYVPPGCPAPGCDIYRGGGLALNRFTGRLILVGNILAGNTGLDSLPDDFAFFDESGPGPRRARFRLGKGWRNVIGAWTMALSPAALGFDASLVGRDPVLGPLQDNGNAASPPLPTALPAGVDVVGAYTPQHPWHDRLGVTRIPETDQRGFVRASRDRCARKTTPGAVDPEGVAPGVVLEAY